MIKLFELNPFDSIKFRLSSVQHVIRETHNYSKAQYYFQSTSAYMFDPTQLD